MIGGANKNRRPGALAHQLSCWRCLGPSDRLAAHLTLSPVRLEFVLARGQGRKTARLVYDDFVMVL